MKTHRKTRRVLALATLWFVVVSVLESSPAHALTLYTIHGTVTDAIGRPLAGVQVTDQGQNTTTAADGTYSLGESSIGTFRITALKAGLVSQTKQVTVLAPIATQVDFALLYALTGSFDNPYVSTASGPGSATYTLRSWAPLPGSPGSTGGHSCIAVTDQRTGAAQAATYVSTNADASSNWTYVVQPPQATPEGGYQLSAIGSDCSSAIALTASSASPYIIDNTPPLVGRFGPFDNHNTIYPRQPLQIQVQDPGLSGINPSAASVTLVDETSATSQTLTPTFDSSLGVFTAVPASDLAVGHHYTFSITVRDRAGNAVSGGSTPYRGDHRIGDGGFDRIDMTATAASTHLAPIACSVALSGTNRVATCPNVAVSVAASSVSVSGSRRSFDRGYILHDVTLTAARLRWTIAAGQTQETDAYAQRLETTSEWQPRRDVFSYDTGSYDALPATFVSTPAATAVQFGTLKAVLPPTWAAAQSVELLMDGQTSYLEGVGSIPRTGACTTPLSASATCDPDPLWTDWTVIFASGSSSQSTVMSDHQAHGVTILRSWTTGPYPAYEGRIPPDQLAYVAQGQGVRSIEPIHSKSLDDYLADWRDEGLSIPPSIANGYASWSDGNLGFSQDLAIDPSQFSSVSRTRPDFAGANELPGPPPDGASVATAPRDSFRMRPLGTLSQANTADAVTNHRVLYAGIDNSYGIEGRPLSDEGLRFSITVVGPSSPRSYSFAVQMPANTSAIAGSDGSVLIADDHAGNADTPVGYIHPPVGRDAFGRDVPVTQTLDNGTLTVAINPEQDTIWPVVIDPTYTAVSCSTSGTGAYAYDYTHVTGWCPYGITFFWTSGYWPVKANIDQTNEPRVVDQNGDCSGPEPDHAAWYDFQVPCRMHDFCWDLRKVKPPYNYSNVSKADCNNLFRDAMITNCATKTIVYQTMCTATADRFKNAVDFADDSPQSRPSGSWPSAQWVYNSSFSSGTSGWTRINAGSHQMLWSVYSETSGQRFLGFTCNGAAGCILQQLVGQANPSFTEQFFGGEHMNNYTQARCEIGTCQARMFVNGFDPTTNSWVTLRSDTFTAPITGSGWWSISVDWVVPQHRYTAVVWGIQLQNSSAIMDIKYPQLNLAAPYN
ncbi:MAG: hypothetical protein QOI95_8 [Acidimicrobiaceae bacterium]|jgi:hypothetical protein